jgi:hypothetical protein
MFRVLIDLILVVYFTPLSVARPLASNDVIIDKYWSDLEGSCHDIIEVLCWHLPGGAEEIHGLQSG